MDEGTNDLQEGGRVHRQDLQWAEAAPHRQRTRRPDDAAVLGAAGRAAATGRTDALGAGAVMSLQRAAGNSGVASLLAGEEESSPVAGVVGHGGGTPLEAPVRQRMEASFGADFSDVRVHQGPDAAASAQAVSARAYTVDNEIVLGDGSGPGSPSHERTLAHELTHVVQQRSGPVDGSPAPGGISLSDPGDRFERAAESTADQVMGGGHADASQGPATGVQRQEGEEEEEVQTLALQRQEGEEEEEVQTLALQRQEGEEEEEVQTLALQRQEGEEEEDVVTQGG